MIRVVVYYARPCVITLTHNARAKHRKYIGPRRDGEEYQARSEGREVCFHKRVYAPPYSCLEYLKTCK